MAKEIRNLISRPIFQPLWKKLLGLSKAGMNIGGGYLYTDSGELLVLETLNKTFKDESSIIIFDVGSHNGGWTKAATKILKNPAIFYCFEPSQKTFAGLHQNLSQFENIKLFNFGFSDQQEKVSFYSNAEGSPMSSLYCRTVYSKNIIMNYLEEVEMKTLTNFCEEEKINQIHFLKLDVEGNELKVLKGAMNLIEAQKIHFIQFEFGEANIDSRNYFRDYFNLLNPFYKIYRILRNGLDTINEYSCNDEIFRVTNYLAISNKLNIKIK